MKAKLVCIILTLTLVFSLIMPASKLLAADIQTISFHVQYGQTDARKMADMVNELRAQNGKTAITYDYNLEKVAMQRAAEIAVMYNKGEDAQTHYRPDGATYKQTLSDFGFNVSPRGILYGENILFGTQDSMKLDGAFGKFSGDEDNTTQMLGNYTIMGIGHVKIEEKTDFWVQIFATRGTPGSFTDPVDGDTVVSVKVDPAFVTDVSVTYAYGDHSVGTGDTVAVPVYIPKIRVAGSEMEDSLELVPLSFDSNDGFVMASGSTMTGLQQGSGTISANLLGRTFSYSVTVTSGSGSGTYVPPTAAPTTIPTTEPTVVPTTAPTTTPEPVVTEVVTATPDPTAVPVTSTPVPTNEPVVVPTTVPTVAPTTAPSPTQKDSGNNTDSGKENGSSLKKGDTFSVDGLKYKVTASDKVAVVGLTSKSATSVSVPATVKYLGKTYKVVSIAASAFSGKTKLTAVTLGKNVKTIGAKAFKGCTTLTSITIPKSVTTIGKSAFYGCSKLKTVTFSGTKIKSIGKNAFAKVNKGAEITVPSSSYKAYKKLLDKSGSTCTIKKK